MGKRKGILLSIFCIAIILGGAFIGHKFIFTRKTKSKQNEGPENAQPENAQPKKTTGTDNEFGESTPSDLLEDSQESEISMDFSLDMYPNFQSYFAKMVTEFNQYIQTTDQNQKVKHIDEMYSLRSKFYNDCVEQYKIDRGESSVVRASKKLLDRIAESATNLLSELYYKFSLKKRISPSIWQDRGFVYIISNLREDINPWRFQLAGYTLEGLQFLCNREEHKFVQIDDVIYDILEEKTSIRKKQSNLFKLYLEIDVYILSLCKAIQSEFMYMPGW